MTSIVIDTNVVSYRFNGDTRGDLYTQHMVGRTPAVSFMTVAEVYRWAVARKRGVPRIASLRLDLAQYLVLPFDDEIAWEWARLMSVPGRPMEAGDAWIAATAVRHGIPLVSHNRSHFDHVPGLQLITEARIV